MRLPQTPHWMCPSTPSRTCSPFSLHLPFSQLHNQTQEKEALLIEKARTLENTNALEITKANLEDALRNIDREKGELVSAVSVT